MKQITILTLLIFSLFGCKEDCVPCRKYKRTNNEEVAKKCAGEQYDLSIFKDFYQGEDFGEACNFIEQQEKEKEISETQSTVCGVALITKVVILCK